MELWCTSQIVDAMEALKKVREFKHMRLPPELPVRCTASIDSRVTLCAQATAVSLLRRFYLRKSFMEHDPRLLT